MPSLDNPDALRWFLEWWTTFTTSSAIPAENCATMPVALEWHTLELVTPRERAFEALKSDISPTPVRKFFDPSKPVTLSVDASKSGLSTVCLQDGWPMLRVLSRKAKLDTYRLRKNFLLQEISWFYLWSRLCHWNRSQASYCSCKKASQYSICPSAKYVPTADLKFIYKTGTKLYVLDTPPRAFTTEEPGVKDDDQLDVLSFSSINPSSRETLRYAESCLFHYKWLAIKAQVRVYPQKSKRTFQ